MQVFIWGVIGCFAARCVYHALRSRHPRFGYRYERVIHREKAEVSLAVVAVSFLIWTVVYAW